MIRFPNGWKRSNFGRKGNRDNDRQFRRCRLVDSGIAAMLIGQDERRLLNDQSAFGSLLEGFVLMELARQLPWSDELVRLFHCRTRVWNRSRRPVGNI
ncbi:MAG: DUF4143 domain-containing protein [Terriglobales bacterium]